MSTATPSTIDRLVLRAAEERWPSARLDAAIARARDLRRDAAGKPCGASYIPREATCHKGAAALTPATVTRAPREGSSWRRKAAMAAGITAAGLAVGLPAASYFQSGSPTGRRASMKVEGFAREAARGLMTWGSGPLAPVGLPLGMGLGAAAEGMRAGRSARRITESWRAAPGYARGAAGLAARKGASAAARESYIASMKNAWASGNKPITPAAARKRAAEVRTVEQQIAALSRQQATRQRAARRAARISRTGAPFTASPTVAEAWLRESLQGDPISRTPASLTAGLLRGLQSTRSGLNARRPRFYGARRDAEGDRLGKPCGESYIPKAHECRKGTGAAGSPPTGPGLTPAKILGAAVVLGAAGAGAYAWSKRDSADLRAAMAERPISGGGRRKPNRIEQLLAERRAQRCANRGDALPLSATNECAISTFAEVYLAKDGASIFKVQKEADLPAARREFEVQAAAFAAGVPTAKPLTIHPRTGVIRMERLAGRTGEELFGENFDAGHEPAYGLQLSAAMRSMHKAGISHGDLHVGNWMDTPQGVRVIDWGQGSRSKDGVLIDLDDSSMMLGLGLSSGPSGRRPVHPALRGYEPMVADTRQRLGRLRFRSPEWEQVIDEHYDAIDAMFRRAAASRT
jgi:tRNA A-37 threonylcarbamoyl transferase component Bud32